MEALVTALLSLALLHNLLLTQGIGLSAALAMGGRLDTACAHAGLTLLSLVPMAALAWTLDHWLLQTTQTTALRLLLWTPACIGAISTCHHWASKRSSLLGERLASPTLRAGALVLHLAVLWWTVTGSPSLSAAAVDALALGAGYAAATILLAAWHGRLASAGLPHAVSMTVALVLSAAIASIVLLGLGAGA